MEIKHSSQTVAPEPVKSSQLGGALYLIPDDESHLPARYLLVSTDKVDKIMGQSTPILGLHEAEIARQLHDLYKSPHPSISRLRRFEGTIKKYKPGKINSGGGYSYRDTGTWHDVHFDGWFLYDEYYTESRSEDELRALTQAYGPVLIPQETYELFGEKPGLLRDGFTSQQRRFECWKVNYNPRRTRRVPYEKAYKQYEIDKEKGFNPDAMTALYKFLDVDRSPQPYNLAANEKLRDNATVGPQYIMQLIKLNLRLLNKPWWRTAEPERNYRVTINTFSEIIAELLKGLHKSEAELAQAKKAADAFTKEQEAAGADDGDYWEEHLKGETGAKLWFCKFLRQEARVLKLKIPPPIKPPVKPKALNHGKKKRKKAKARSRARTAASAPAS